MRPLEQKIRFVGGYAVDFEVLDAFKTECFGGT
jgi:hypothetical protein